MRFLKYKTWFSLLFFQILVFVIFSSEVRESEIGQPELVGLFDRRIMTSLYEIRDPILTAIAVDLTALGSTAILTLATFLAFFFFIARRRISDAIYIVLVSIGAALLSQIAKTYFERPRPPIVSRLVEIQGFSYPSGHSLVSTAFYLNLALLICTFFDSRKQKYFVFSFSLTLILLIATSRIYLGVHYPTDVIGGIMLGSLWTTFMFGLKIVLSTGHSWNT